MKCLTIATASTSSSPPAGSPAPGGTRPAEIAPSDQQQPEAVVLAAQWLSLREPAIRGHSRARGGDARTTTPP